MDSGSRLNLLEAQLRENYGKIVYSHKTQEKCADILSLRNKWIKTIQIVLTALTTTGLFVRIFSGQEWALIASTVFATLQFGVTLFVKEYNLGEIIEKHKVAALELLDVREQYLSLLTDLKAGVISADEIIPKREQLQKRLTDIYSRSPRTFKSAYSSAQKALKIREELTFNDKEIDNFLPPELRKS